MRRFNTHDPSESLTFAPPTERLTSRFRRWRERHSWARWTVLGPVVILLLWLFNPARLLTPLPPRGILAIPGFVIGHILAATPLFLLMLLLSFGVRRPSWHGFGRFAGAVAVSSLLLSYALFTALTAHEWYGTYNRAPFDAPVWNAEKGWPGAEPRREGMVRSLVVDLLHERPTAGEVIGLLGEPDEQDQSHRILSYWVGWNWIDPVALDITIGRDGHVADIGVRST